MVQINRETTSMHRRKRESTNDNEGLVFTEVGKNLFSLEVDVFVKSDGG